MTTRVTRRIAAPRERVHGALVDPDAVARWRFPQGMSCLVHEFAGVEGGTLSISLTYDSPDGVGKTSGRTDTYRGRFARLVPNELVVEVDAFESEHPALSGEMTSTIRLADAPGGGTDLIATHEGLPSSVSPEDNDRGWRCPPPPQTPGMLDPCRRHELRVAAAEPPDLSAGTSDGVGDSRGRGGSATWRRGWRPHDGQMKCLPCCSGRRTPEQAARTLSTLLCLDEQATRAAAASKPKANLAAAHGVVSTGWASLQTR